MINKMSFIDHLEELRVRVLKSILCIFFFSITGYYFSNYIINLLILPIEDNHVDLQVLKITSVFMVKIGVGIIVGILASIPFVLYQCLQFILPVFENKLTNLRIIFIIFICMVLFVIGLIFGYNILIPISINFFKNISINLDFISLNYTIENYLIYLIWILIISSFIFQLPLLLITLIKIGIIDIDSLVNHRKHVVVIVFIIAAILTPPDPLSQFLVVIPIYILFELSIFVARFIK